MATEHTAVGVRRKVKLLVHISGRPLVVLVIPLYIMVCMDVWSKILPILVYLTAGTRRTRPIHTHDRYTHDFTERSPM